jgi:hypothetical protein
MNTWLHRFCDSITRFVDCGDVVFAASVASVIYGVAQVYTPAAWILGGVLLAIAAISHGGSNEERR